MKKMKQDRETHPHLGLMFQMPWNYMKGQRDGDVGGKGKRGEERDAGGGGAEALLRFQAQVLGLSNRCAQRGLSCCTQFSTVCPRAQGFK